MPLIYLFIYLFVYLFIYLFIYLVSYFYHITGALMQIWKSHYNFVLI